MGKIYTGNGWIIRVQGMEHPPVHAHVLHANGRALVSIDGTVVNSAVPQRVIAEAVAWIEANKELVIAEWHRMNNPEQR